MADILSNSWTPSDSGNTNAPPDGLPTGSMPNKLAPTIRQIMGANRRLAEKNAVWVTSTGTANTLAIAYTVAPDALRKGDVFRFFSHIANTGATTLNVNSLGAKPIVRNDGGGALTAGQIAVGQAQEVAYDGTSFRLLNSTPNPTFSGAVNVGSLVSAGSITGTAGNFDSLGVTGDITLAGALKVSAANGIVFANDDKITYDDTTNTWTFAADTTGGSLTSQIATNVLTLTGTANVLRLDTPAGDVTGDPYMSFNKNGTRQGYIQHNDGTSDTNGFRIFNDVTGDTLVLGNVNSINTLKFYDASTGLTNTIWHSGNDGPSSTLDADTVDGYEAASLYRNNANFDTTGNLKISNTGPYISFIETNDTSDWRIYLNGGVFSIQQDDAGDGTFEAPNALNLDRAALRGELWGQKIWTAGNDGAGSTLDADLLDGQQGSFYQSASNLNAGTLPNARIAGAYDGITTLTAGALRLTNTSDASDVSTLHALQIGATNSNNVIMDSNEIMFRNNGVLTSATINGIGASINAGTGAITLATSSTTGVNVSGGYLRVTGSAPEIKLIDTTSGEYSARLRVNGNNVYFDSSTDDVTFGEVFRFELDTKNGYVNNSLIWTDANTTSARVIAEIGYTPASVVTSITAGNGLTGGGTLAATRTVTLGTPGSITNTSTNAVTTTSHTHALGFTAEEVYTGTSATYAAYPLGATLMVHRDGAAPALNASFTCATRNDVDYGFINATHGNAGTNLAGTYRSRGLISDWCLMQRTA